MNELAYKHEGMVKDGELYLNNPDLYLADLKRREGRKVYIGIYVQDENDVSPNQHAYYRGVVLPHALRDPQFGGWTKSELHNFLQKKFLSHERLVKLRSGERVVNVTESTSGIGMKRMAEYVDQVIQFLASEGIVIPEAKNFINEKQAKKI